MHPHRRRRRALWPGTRWRAVGAVVLAALAAAAAGCGGGEETKASGTVRAIATTTVLGEIVRTVGDDAVSVTQLLQPNSDPHDYEPRPHDVVEAAKADVVFASGDGLDEWITDVVEQSAGHADLVDVGAALSHRVDDRPHAGDHRDADDAHGHADDTHRHAPDAHGHATDDGHDHGPIDPHWWHDPTNVIAAVEVVRDELTRRAPADRATFAANAQAYVSKLQALDAGIRRCLAAVPPARRRLVTDHASLGWFAARYGITVVGTVIPSRSTQAQASAGDVAELARTIRREGVTAIFPEAGSSRKLPEALARETGATAAYHLYGDSLGPAGSDAATYLGMAAHNADAMVRGFTDGRRGCELDDR